MHPKSGIITGETLSFVNLSTLIGWEGERLGKGKTREQFFSVLFAVCCLPYTIANKITYQHEQARHYFKNLRSLCLGLFNCTIL